MADKVCKASDTVVMPRLLKSSDEMDTTGDAVAAAGLRVSDPVTTMVLPSSASCFGCSVSCAKAVPQSRANAVKLVAPRRAAFWIMVLT